MRKYKTDEVLNINGGKVSLDKDQARRRKLRIKKVKAPKEEVKKGDEIASPYVNGIYEVLHPITFKAGETFGWDGEFGRAQTLFVHDLEKEAKLAEVVDKKPDPVPDEQEAAEKAEADELERLQQEIDDQDAAEAAESKTAPTLPPASQQSNKNGNPHANKSNKKNK